MRVALFLVLTLAASGCAPSTPAESRERAYRAMEWRANLGDDEQAYTLVFFRQWLEGDRDGAIREFRRMGEGGNRYASAFLGVHYWHPDMGADQDFEEAARWLRLAAEQGSEPAAKDLAHYNEWLASGAAPEAAAPAQAPEAR